MSSPNPAVVVLGGGLAGLTAGLFAARAGHQTLVLAPEGPAGAFSSIELIEDFPGFPDGVSGYELGPLLYDQAAAAGAAFEMSEAVAVSRDGDAWLVEAGEVAHRARAVIVATGTQPRRLGVPGERDFEGAGISHCASCDGPLFRERTVAVVGGGDSGLMEALELTKHVAAVTVLEREPTLTAQATYRRRVEAQSGIETMCCTVVEAVLGSGTISGVRIRDTRSQELTDMNVGGLFVYVGREPATSFLEGVIELDPAGHIRTDSWMSTRLDGVFAAGDVRADAPGQAVTAAGEGATAALAAHRYLTQA